MIIFTLFYSCKIKKIHENINNENYLQDNEIELLDTDYKIIDYSETEFTIIVKGKQIRLEIEVTNSDKIMQLNKLIDPIIYLKINNKKCLARGRAGYKSMDYNTLECDYTFPIDRDKKIMYFEDNRIHLLGLFYE
jgi:hypothetical protein